MKGRCAGCARSGSVREITRHAAECPGFLALFRADPARALDPASEHARWLAQDKADERTCRRARAVADVKAARAAGAARFVSRDIPDD